MSHLLLGTAKGLVVYQKSNSSWKYASHHFLGVPVSIAIEDPHSGNWWVCLDHKHWGPKIHFSEDRGGSWIEVGSPKYPEHAELRPGLPATLRYIWCIAFGPQPGILYLGTEPGGLFKTADYGKNFELVEGLWNHPSRIDHWFGGGRNYPGIHSIVIDPNNGNHIYVGISCAGVFESNDGGESWEVRNQGLKADFLPNPEVEVGHDPHLVLACQEHPRVMWQQNHCGIFRSEDGGLSWRDITDAKELGRYGFTIAIDHQDPLRAWVIPATSDAQRIAIDQRLLVMHTEDGGSTWIEQRNGLPQSHCFDIVLRHAFDIADDTLVFGTSAGSLYCSYNRGNSWNALNHHLPRIFSVIHTHI